MKANLNCTEAAMLEVGTCQLFRALMSNSV